MESLESTSLNKRQRQKVMEVDMLEASLRASFLSLPRKKARAFCSSEKGRQSVLANFKTQKSRKANSLLKRKGSSERNQQPTNLTNKQKFVNRTLA
jgi:hypothetical protein